MMLWFAVGALTAIIGGYQFWRDEQPNEVQIVDVAAMLVVFAGLIMLGPVSLALAITAIVDTRHTGDRLGQITIWRRK